MSKRSGWGVGEGKRRRRKKGTYADQKVINKLGSVGDKEVEVFVDAVYCKHCVLANISIRSHTST